MLISLHGIQGASSEEVEKSKETSFRGKRDNDWTVELIRRLEKCSEFRRSSDAGSGHKVSRGTKESQEDTDR